MFFDNLELDALINLERVDLDGNEIDKFVLSKGIDCFPHWLMVALPLDQPKISLIELYFRGWFCSRIKAQKVLKLVLLLLSPADTRGFGNVSFISLSNSTSNGKAIPFTLLQSLTKFPNLSTLSLTMNNLEGSFGTTLDKGNLWYWCLKVILNIC